MIINSQSKPDAVWGSKLEMADIQVDRSLEKLFPVIMPLAPTAKDVNDQGKDQGKDQGLAGLSYEKKLDNLWF